MYFLLLKIKERGCPQKNQIIQLFLNQERGCPHSTYCTYCFPFLKKGRGCHQKNQIIQLFLIKNADAIIVLIVLIVFLFKKKNADALRKIRLFSCF